jgi:ketosteroid isomerase-like protein
MAATSAEIEARALGLMRAWVAGDAKAVKKLVARDAMVMVGALPPQLLDRPSFLAALDRGFACTRFTFREVFVRAHGKAAWFVAGAELELAFGGKPWSGPFLVTDLWRKGAIGGWKLAERSLAPLGTDSDLAPRIAKLQLWNTP